MHRAGHIVVVVAVLTWACASDPSSAHPVASLDSGSGAPVATAGFVEVPPRDVTVHGTPVHIAATARLFYNLQPAVTNAADRPIVFLFNGFAAEIVRAFGTGPMTVEPGGAVVPNPTPLTEVANLVYLEPRQSGYSYDVGPGTPPAGPTTDDCSPLIFNEYVDAADVLFAALELLEMHPELHGPVYWMGESYAGVRITWILTYLRGRWGLAPFTDPSLEAKIAAGPRAASLFAGQVLLEAWIAGGPEADAIAAVCADPVVASDVAASAGASCNGDDACTCTTTLGRSLYNYTFTNAYETSRETEASLAHVDPARAAALIGSDPLRLPQLSAAVRGQGFKCVGPDATVPSDAALVAALGPLPAGQSYYVPDSPLLPGKENSPTTLDWRTTPTEALAFVDALHDVPALLTHGDRDLVVPTSAVVPALSTAIGAARVDASSPSRIGVVYPDGTRYIDVYEYPAAGHMITMVEPAQFAADLRTWLAAR